MTEQGFSLEPYHWVGGGPSYFFGFQLLRPQTSVDGVQTHEAVIFNGIGYCESGVIDGVPLYCCSGMSRHRTRWFPTGSILSDEQWQPERVGVG